MFKLLRCSAIIFVIILLSAQTSFATTMSFSDTITNPSTSGWTHILDYTDFGSEWVAGDTINTIMDAALDIRMDIDLAGQGNVKLFEVSATGDHFLLDTLSISSPHGTINNKLWSIDLGTVSNAATTLRDIKNGGTFEVTLSSSKGSIRGIDFATLSGLADVIAPINPDPVPNPTPDPTPDPTPPLDPINPVAPVQPIQPIPEPSTILLIGAGLLAIELARKRMKR